MTASATIGDASGTRGGLSFRRLELKYLVDRTTRTALAQDLASLMDPDGYAGPDGSYLVRSLYFDTPDYLCYHDKLAGVPIRHKLRARSYGDTTDPDCRVRLEVKSRYLTYIHKTCQDFSADEYRELESNLRRGILPPEKLRTHSEFFRQQRQYNMEPKVIVQYRRQAFQRMELRRVRVNFDDELLATRSLELLGPLHGARPLLPYGYAVFEIKVDDYMPYWLHVLIGKYNLQTQAFSKYCHAVRRHALLSARRQPDE